MNYFDDFRFNLKYYREIQDISQIQLSILCNCGTGTIGGIEAGKAKPSFDMIVKIANALQISPADLFVRDATKEKMQIKNELKIKFDKIIKEL